MPTVTVAHHPELTGQGAMEVFQRHLGGKYKIYESYVPTRDFVVKRSGWTGVWVKLVQEEDSSSFLFAPYMPSIRLRFVFAIGGLIAWQFLRRSWSEIEEDVRSVIENASEFR